MNHNKLMKTVLLVLAIVLCVTTLNALIHLNGIPPRVDLPSQAALQDLTVDGASLFLQSNAEALLLLNEMELSEKSGFNFFVAQQLTDSAIAKLESARLKYQRIVNLGSSAKLDEDAFTKLSRFDFNRLAVDEDLNREMMQRVGSFLSRGDLAGLYRRNLQNIEAIQLLLGQIKGNLTDGQVPDIHLFWKLLRHYSDSILFGNYATLVFGQI